MHDYRLTRCELEVMSVVWNRGRVTVQDVVDALDRPLAYTTVMTTLKVLADTRSVLHRSKSKQGRAFVYEPAVTREQVTCSITGELSQTLFGGSIKSLMMSMIGGGAVSSQDITELKQAIDQLECLK